MMGHDFFFDSVSFEEPHMLVLILYDLKTLDAVVFYYIAGNSTFWKLDRDEFAEIP